MKKLLLIIGAIFSLMPFMLVLYLLFNFITLTIESNKEKEDFNKIFEIYLKERSCSSEDLKLKDVDFHFKSYENISAFVEFKDEPNIHYIYVVKNKKIVQMQGVVIHGEYKRTSDLDPSSEIDASKLKHYEYK